MGTRAERNEKTIPQVIEMNIFCGNCKQLIMVQHTQPVPQSDGLSVDLKNLSTEWTEAGQAPCPNSQNGIHFIVPQT